MLEKLTGNNQFLTQTFIIYLHAVNLIVYD